MPINLVSKATGNAGSTSVTLGDAASNFDGTFVNPAAITGSANANLGQSDADFVGLFTQLPDRTGTIATILSDGSADFTSVVPSGEPYDLSGFTDLHYAITWPDVPAASIPVNVSSASAFQAATDLGGRIITVTSSFSGSVTLRDDTDVIMANNLTITGNVTVNGSRIRWTGGNVNGRTIIVNGADVLWNDYYTYVAGSAANAPHDFTAASNAFHRVAIINSTFEVTAPSNNDNWALFVGTVSPHCTDLILANFKCISTGQNNRFNNTDRLTIVDSVFNPNGASANGFRIHHSCTGVYIGDSWGRGLFKADAVNGSDTGPSLLDARFNNFDRYYVQYMFNGGFANTGTVLNSTLHGNTTTAMLAQISPLTNGGGNTGVTWDGSTVPDYSTVGANH